MTAQTESRTMPKIILNYDNSKELQMTLFFKYKMIHSKRVFYDFSAALYPCAI